MSRVRISMQVKPTGAGGVRRVRETPNAGNEPILSARLSWSGLPDLLVDASARCQAGASAYAEAASCGKRDRTEGWTAAET